MSTIKRLAMPSVGKDVEEMALSDITVGKVKWGNYFGK
jgi:hypothetical protein